MHLRDRQTCFLYFVGRLLPAAAMQHEPREAAEEAARYARAAIAILFKDGEPTIPPPPAPESVEQNN
jgi:hypothetical protein